MLLKSNLSLFILDPSAHKTVSEIKLELQETLKSSHIDSELEVVKKVIDDIVFAVEDNYGKEHARNSVWPSCCGLNGEAYNDTDTMISSFIFAQENVQILDKNGEIGELSRGCSRSNDFSILTTNLDGVGRSSENCLCRLYSNSFEIEGNPPSYSAEVLQALKEGYKKAADAGGKKLFFMGKVPYSLTVVTNLRLSIAEIPV